MKFMLIDDVKIKIAGGDGGKGAVAFNKNMMSLGPVGGSGGNGGNVYAEGIADLSALRQFRFKKDFAAENGQDGKPQFNDGHDGKDIILKVPVGTVIHNLDTKADIEIIKIGEKVLIAKGGHGGKGNFHFRSSTNTSPKQFQEGLPGEKFTIRLELKLIADVGFIGLPNIGKSTLLNELTAAKSKVANYPFTTLEPNLGAYYELILADIPGLIEGASMGKGLGIKFLRHIERTKILFHFISADSENPEKDYKIVKNELKKYSLDLAKKPEYLFLSKSDLLKPAEIKKKVSILKKLNKLVIPFSVLDEESLRKIKDILNKIKEEKFEK
ncbi:GTPase ObgE [Candidatus Wolfebacteria bacterium]|nr:GTPase ObgE [Candidatus Wolfebacteria bacterium]